MTICNNECVSLGSDPENCGACGIQCGKFERCVMGECTFSCATVDENINTLMECPIGSKQCYDIMTSNDHCGMCDNSCGENQVCVQGLCQDCPPGYKRCGDVITEEKTEGNITAYEYFDHRTCVDVMNDNMNCGDCGNICEGICQNGECIVDGGQPDGGQRDITLEDLQNTDVVMDREIIDIINTDIQDTVSTDISGLDTGI